MDFKDIKKIVELMNEHELSFFHLEKDEFNLKLKKGSDAPIMMQSAPMAAAPAPAVGSPAPTPAAPSTGDAPAAAADGDEITSPMVGTLYRKPTPEADDFVEVGAKVSEGQTLCIIEAMKVMNEIKAQRSGTITSILVDDATPVMFGDALFTIK